MTPIQIYSKPLFFLMNNVKFIKKKKKRKINVQLQNS